MATTQPAADPLDLPLPGAGFGASLSRFFRKYAVFSGRASRSEFWLVYLALIAVQTVLYVIMRSDSSGETSLSGTIAAVLMVVLSLGCIVPQLAVTWRRLHDANFAGPMYFLGCIPFVGGLVLLILLLMPSREEGARFDTWR